MPASVPEGATPTAVPSGPTPLASPTRTPLPAATAVNVLTPPPAGESGINDTQRLENLVAFSRLFGYVRYFHPSDQVASDGVNWSRVAAGGVKVVADAATPVELAQRLEDYFRPLAPTLQVFTLDAEPPPLLPDLALPPDITDLKVVMWEHLGVAGERSSIYESSRKRETVLAGQIPAGFHDPGQPYYAELNGSLAARIPLTLYANNSGTLPLSEEPADHGLRLSMLERYPAGVIIAWNVFQHFYPYFDVVDTDWNQVLVDSLAAALAAENDGAYEEVLWALLVELQDGHAFIESRQPVYFLPLALDWIEEQLLVVSVTGEAAGQLQPGDAVLAIDGQPAEQLLQAAMNGVPAATEQWRLRVAMWRIISGSRSGRVVVEVETPDGERRELSLARASVFLDRQQPDLEPIAEIEPGIFYVDFTRIEDRDFEAALPKLVAADSLIFDMRGYPTRVSPEPLRHLTAVPVDSQQFLAPLTTWPDRQRVQYEDASWTLPPKEPYLAARKIFLINGRAISYAEVWMGIVAYHGLAEALVGEATAGTNGNVNVFAVPGDRFIRWTGMKVLGQDGGQFHGIGILPTHPVLRTRQAVIEGRDEALELALELLRR
jgi:hypothetical protein